MFRWVQTDGVLAFSAKSVGLFRMPPTRWADVEIPPALPRGRRRNCSIYGMRSASVAWSCVAGAPFPPPLPPDTDDPNLLIFLSVSPRNIEHARRRWIRASISPISNTQWPPAMADGAALQVPSGDETVPDRPEVPLSFRTTFGFVDSSSGTAQRGGGFQTATSAYAPKQTGDDLDAQPPPRPRGSTQLGQLSGDDEFRA